MSSENYVSENLCLALLVWLQQRYKVSIWERDIRKYVYNPYLKRERKIYRYFVDRSGIFQIFVNENYPHPYEVCFHQAQEIKDAFKKWFSKKRDLVMENAALEMAKHNEKIFKPTSHSGIASLLHVLTRTMEKQGADITSIAKVQYAVCVQAGVYLPDEFLLDVAIAMDIEQSS